MVAHPVDDLHDDPLTEIFGAVANGERRAILDYLSVADTADHRNRTVVVMARELGVSRFSVSHHLRALREAGLVVGERVGTSRPHRIAQARLLDAFDWLDAVLDRSATRNGWMK